jgi:acetoin utilization protein AcuB
MSKTVVTVEMDDKLRTLKEFFDHVQFHHLLVVEAGKLFGVVSDRDLLKALSPKLGTISESEKDAATLNKRVHQIMTRNPISLHPEASVLDAVHMFNTHRISCIPIVDTDRQPVGLHRMALARTPMVIAADILRSCTAQQQKSASRRSGTADHGAMAAALVAVINTPNVLACVQIPIAHRRC